MLAPAEIGGRVAASLRAVRRARKLSQHDLGDLAGVTASAISQVERAERGLSLATLVRLSAALGVTIDDLLRGEEPGVYRIGRRTDDPEDGLEHTVPLLGGPDLRDRPRPPRPARVRRAVRGRAPGTGIVAVASGLVQVQVAGQTPAVRHGEVLVADSEHIAGWRNLGQAEAELFWIVTGGASVLGRVAVVQGEQVAVGVGEERLVADAGVQDPAAELDPVRLELARASPSTSSTASATIDAARRELEPEGVRLHDGEREVAGLVLRRGHLPPRLHERQTERLAVELGRLGVVFDLERDEVDAGDVGHGADNTRRDRST